MRHKADLLALLCLYHWLRQQRPAILHTYLFHANLLGRVLGRLAGVPLVICSERTMQTESKARYRLNRWTVGLADRVVAVSASVADFCIDHVGLPADKLVVIPNGVDLPVEPPASRQETRAELALSAAEGLDLPPDAPVIGAVCRLDPLKGLNFLLQALARLAGVWLVVVGDGPERDRLVALTVELGLAGRVCWAGQRRDVSRLLSAFDLFVQPSLHEGLPNAVLEAMAAGLPVVATAVGGTPEAVVDGVTGLLVPPADVEALAQALAGLLADPERRQRLGRAGRQRVAEHFSLAQMVAKTERLYRDLSG
jgi:glycosyltransferase involved in cell wall biosynthesis